jgi:hypothetical protein
MYRGLVEVYHLHHPVFTPFNTRIVQAKSDELPSEAGNTKGQSEASVIA